MRDGYDALVQLGGASPGDKTMLDALLPFVEELQRRVVRRRTWQDAWRAAADVATEAAGATADLRPKVGRARRSPNAVSARPMRARPRWRCVRARSPTASR